MIDLDDDDEDGRGGGAKDEGYDHESDLHLFRVALQPQGMIVAVVPPPAGLPADVRRKPRRDQALRMIVVEASQGRTGRMHIRLRSFSLLGVEGDFVRQIGRATAISFTRVLAQGGWFFGRFAQAASLWDVRRLLQDYLDVPFGAREGESAATPIQIESDDDDVVNE